ncbi:MAG: hypothetical protein QOE14_3133 [Humisphaera sp.]|nr:hypothetical protein [Humisphaera sp.]
MRQLFKLRRGSRRHADNAESPPPEPTIAWPPRWRWLKRLSIAYLIFIACVALLYWAWTAYSHRQLASAIAAVQARGEPVLYEEFDPPPIAADRNAAVLLVQAAKLFEPDADWTRKLTQVPQYNLSSSVRWLRLPQDIAVVDGLITRNQPALRLVRDARALEAADWGVRIRKRMINILLPHLGGQNGLDGFLTAAAFTRHLQGDDAEALELCRDLLALGEHVGDSAPFGPSQFVSYACAKDVADVVEQVAAHLDLTDRAARASASTLIAELLDERRMSQNRLLTAQAARAFAADIFQGYLEGNGAVIEPAYRIDAARALRRRERDVEAARRASYADVVQLLPDFEPQWQGGPDRDTPRWRAAFWHSYPPRLLRQTRVVTTFFRRPRDGALSFHRACCDRRAAATLLAARLYQIDHDGRLPSKWDDLVPAYLPFVPPDPFAPNLAPLKLVRRYSDTIVYSVGKDLVDDAGAEFNKRGRPSWRRQGDDTIDLVYHFRTRSPDDAQ